MNRKAEELSINLFFQGYNVPIVAGSDVHAKNPKLMNSMGKGRFIIDIEGSTPYEILQDTILYIIPYSAYCPC